MIASMPNSSLPSIEIDPSKSATKTLIWLHGLGADGNDFVPITQELALPEANGIRFIFPHAPFRPITINNGYQMRAWFDIAGFSLDSKEDTAGILESVNATHQLIRNEEARGIAANQVILAGFSQGASVALIAGLSYVKTLAGIIALSGFLPRAHINLGKKHPQSASIPIFLAHGTEDPVVPYVLGELTYKLLSQTHTNVAWHSYPMPHSVCPEEIKDISHFIRKVLNI